MNNYEFGKGKKKLVTIISYGSSPKILRASIYDFCNYYYRFSDENLIAKYIPEDLRYPNSNFMMVWKDNKLIKIERLKKSEITYINNVIEKYEKSLDYLDIKENQEIDNEYLHYTKDFFNKILEVNYPCGIISDKSCLDYHAIAFEKSLENYKKKIKLYYNVDIVDIIKKIKSLTI